MLADKIEHYKQTGKLLQTTPAQYKAQYEWLKEVDSLALANAQLNLQSAYKTFSVRSVQITRNSRVRNTRAIATRRTTSTGASG